MQRQQKRNLQRIRIDCLDDEKAPYFCDKELPIPVHFTKFYSNFLEHYKVHHCDYFTRVSCNDDHGRTFLSTLLIKTLGSPCRPDTRWYRNRNCFCQNNTNPYSDEHLRIRYFDITKNNCNGRLFQLDSEGCIETFSEDFENLLPKDVNMIVRKKEARLYLPFSHLCGSSLKGLCLSYDFF